MEGSAAGVPPLPRCPLPYSSRSPGEAPLPRSQASTGIRYATIKIKSDGEPFELTVTQLPSSPGNLAAYILSNINRWREQMQLREISPEQLAGNAEEIDLDGNTATLVNLVGTMSAGSSTSSGAVAAAGVGTERPKAKRSPPKPSVTYETPTGWSPGQLVVSRGGIRVPRQAAHL